MSEIKHISNTIKDFKKDDLKLFYNLFKSYDKKIISLEEFLFYGNDIFLNNKELMKEAVLLDNKNQKISNILNFVPEEKLNELKNEYSLIMKNNDKSINNINLIISNKEDQMNILLEKAFGCLGWLRETSFSERGLCFKISPQIHVPYHLRDKMTKEELLNYKIKCKKELEERGFSFGKKGDDYTRDALKVGDKNVELFENAIKESLDGVRFTMAESKFERIDTIELYCQLDCKFINTSIDNVCDKANDDISTNIVTPLILEKIDKIVKEYLSYLGTGYYLIDNDITTEEKNQCLSNKDIVISSITSYISSIAKIYQLLEKTNDIVEFYESNQYSSIRSIMKEIHEYENKIKESQMNLDINDLLDNEMLNIKKIFNILFCCSVEPLIKKHTFSLELRFTFDDLLINILEHGLKNQKVSETFIEKARKELLDNLEVIKPFGSYHNTDVFVLLNDKNINYIKIFCMSFGIKIKDIQSENMMDNLIIKRFTVSMDNVLFTFDAIHSYLKENEKDMFVCNDKE